MRIAVDARPLSGPQTGIARYTLNLLRHMTALGHQWFLYSDKPPCVDFDLSPSVQLRCGDVRSKSVQSLLWTQWQFSRWATQDVVDLFWSPRHHLPLKLSRDIARVVTIHDLVWRHYPKTMLWQNLWLERALMGPSIRNADRVICVSRFTAGEVSRYYPAALGKCSVIHEASTSLNPAAGKAGGIRPQQPYLLFVGTLEPRKNLARLLRAYGRLAGNTDVPDLVIAGGRGWGDTGLAGLLKQMKLKQRVHLTGFVDDVQLQALYQGAHALVIPSLYEGFGLPALEAMSCGVPVIASSTSALPETVGDAALLVNPYSEAEIATAIMRLVEDRPLRSELSLKAQQRSRLFSWQQSAQQTLDLFEQTLARHEPKPYRLRVLEQVLD